MSYEIPGKLEIDTDRGVIYFHVASKTRAERIGGITLLRICQLPTPIPDNQMLDITHMTGASWAPMQRRWPTTQESTEPNWCGNAVIGDMIEKAKQEQASAAAASAKDDADLPEWDTPGVPVDPGYEPDDFEKAREFDRTHPGYWEQRDTSD